MKTIKKEPKKETVSRKFILVLVILVIVTSIIGTLSVLISLPNLKYLNFAQPSSKERLTSTDKVIISLDIEEPAVITTSKAKISLYIEPSG